MVYRLETNSEVGSFGTVEHRVLENLLVLFGLQSQFLSPIPYNVS